jgi:hypothetical protein
LRRREDFKPYQTVIEDMVFTKKEINTFIGNGLHKQKIYIFLGSLTIGNEASFLVQRYLFNKIGKKLII